VVDALVVDVEKTVERLQSVRLLPFGRSLHSKGSLSVRSFRNGETMKACTRECGTHRGYNLILCILMSPLYWKERIERNVSHSPMDASALASGLYSLLHSVYPLPPTTTHNPPRKSSRLRRTHLKDIRRMPIPLHNSPIGKITIKTRLELSSSTLHVRRSSSERSYGCRSIVRIKCANTLLLQPSNKNCIAGNILTNRRQLTQHSPASKPQHAHDQQQQP